MQAVRLAIACPVQKLAHLFLFVVHWLGLGFRLAPCFLLTLVVGLGVIHQVSCLVLSSKELIHGSCRLSERLQPRRLWSHRLSIVSLRHWWTGKSSGDTDLECVVEHKLHVHRDIALASHIELAYQSPADTGTS